MVYIQLEKTDYEVIIFLIENFDKEFSIREISEKLKRPYVKIHSSIKRLEDKKIIKKEIKGKSHYCSIDYINNINIVCFVNSLKAKQFLLNNKKIKIIIDDIKSELNIPDYILLIFGSYSKGNQSLNSDLDIAIICSSEDKETCKRLINSKKRISNIDIHSFEFTYKEFIEMLKSKEMNVGNEIVNNCIIFSGCEQYYKSIILSK